MKFFGFIGILVLILVTLSNCSPSARTDVEIKYINYLLNKISAYVQNANVERKEAFEKNVKEAIEKEWDFLKTRLDQESLIALEQQIKTSVSGALVSSTQENILSLLIQRIEKKFQFKFSLPTNGESYHNPARSCSDVLKEYRFATSGVYWVNPPMTTLTFQQFCDMTNDGWGLMAKIGADVERESVALMKYNLNDDDLYSTELLGSGQQAHFRTSRFESYGSDWILRIVSTGSNSLQYLYLKPDGKCDLKDLINCTFKSQESDVEIPVQELKFNSGNRNVLPDNHKHLTYYVHAL